MFVRNCAVTTGPSRECDITFFVKGRPKSAQQLRDSTVAVRRAQSVTVPSSRVSRECRSSGLRSPPLKMPNFKLPGKSGDFPEARGSLTPFPATRQLCLQTLAGTSEVRTWCKIATRATIYRSLWALRAQIAQKSPKESFFTGR